MKAARKKPMDTWELADIEESVAGSAIAQRGQVTEVLESNEITRDNAGTIIPDSGDAGLRLAQYLLEVVK